MFAAISACAAAGHAGPAEQKKANALFQEGRKAMKNKDYDTACPKFEASLELDPAPGTRINLGLCREARNELSKALEDFRRVAEQLPKDDSRAAFVQERVAALEARVPRITITLAKSAPADAVVTIDDQPVQIATPPSAKEIEPGDHVVSVRATGREPREYKISLADFQRRDLEVDAGKSLAVTPTGAATGPESGAGDGGQQQDGPPWRTIGFVVGGIGIAAVTVGAIAGIVVLSNKGTIEDDCGPRFCASQDGLDAVSSAGTFSTVSTIAFIAGGAALAGGAVLLLTHPESGGSAHVGAAPRPGGAVVAVGGTFR